jgi:hypothetical protein
MYSDRNEIRFTLNLTVASKQKWAEMRAQSKGRPHPHTSRPAANNSYGKDMWQRRIGQLLPTHSDHWWTLGPD